MQLTGKQVQQIQDALLDGYRTKDELAMMVFVRLEQNLEAITVGANLRVIIFNLVSWAAQTDRVDDLIQGASDYNPDNEVLQQIAKEWRATMSSQAAVQPAAAATSSPPTGRVSVDLFLSYSRKDLASMRSVRDSLREAELSVWTDEGLEPGTPGWQAAIADAIGQAQAMVVLLSPDAKDSAWVGNEVTYAQLMGKRVFTALVAGEALCAVPINLVGVQWVDGRQDLRRAVAQELRPAILRYLHRPQMILPPIEFDWVVIPAGEFLMGSDKSKDKQADDDETRQHKLYLPEFRIARVPVTVAQFAMFVEATSYTTTAEERGSAWAWNGSEWEEVKGANWAHPRGPDSNVKQKADHPVTCVSWHDAKAFSTWAAVRLPTEAEWEKAARGTDGRIWPWGNQKPNKELCNFNMDVGDTTVVGSYPKGASPYGVLDAAGNVWEWTSSLWGDDVSKPTYGYPYKPDDGRENLGAPDSVRRTLRGGAWSSGGNLVRCAYRDDALPNLRFDSVGFRVLSPGG